MGMTSFSNAQSWLTFPLFYAWVTWNEVEIYDTKTSQEGSTHVEGENRKRKNKKRRNINCRRKDNWRKRKGSKEKDDGKGCRETRCLIEGHPCLVAFVYESDNNVVSQRLVEKVQLPTSFHLNQARIKFSTGQCVKEVLYDSAPTNSYHLLFRLAWLHFKALNLDEHSLYLRHEGHEMKFKFMTPRQASKDQHRLKEKIEKERNINCRRKGNWTKRKGRKDKDDGKESRETRCWIEGHPCLVEFVYESENNVVS